MAGLFMLVMAAPCICPVVQLAASSEPTAGVSALHFICTTDHPSGIYHPNEHAAVTVLIDNPTDAEQTLEGDFQFVRRGDTTAQQQKPVATIPIARTTIQPGQRVRIQLALTPPVPGTYDVSCDSQSTSTTVGRLECLYAPRRNEMAAADSPWIARLPEEAFSNPEYLADAIPRIGVHYFVWDCAWKPGQREIFDSHRQALRQTQLDAAIHALQSTSSQLVLRLHPQIDVDAPDGAIAQINSYAAALIAKCHGVCKAVSVAMNPVLADGHPDTARDVYLAIYAAAKKQDRAIVMLGFSTAAQTHALLSGTVGGARLNDYVDALGVDAAATDALPILDDSTPQNLAIWILPAAKESLAVPAVVALAAGSRMIPVPAEDHGLTLHLLGGAVLYQNLHAGFPPWCAVFQADGFAVAAIAGMGVGTPMDRAWPGLMAVMPAQAGDLSRAPADDAAVMEVADPDTSLRAVGWDGHAINCRRGDMLRIPLDGRLCYLVESGSAEDLVAGLRTAELQHWPDVEVTVLQAKPAGPDRATPVLVLRMRNATDHDVKAQVRLADKSSSTDVVTLSQGKFVEAELPVSEVPTGPLDLEVLASGRAVRLTVAVPK
jgi:hypothetical protein